MRVGVRLGPRNSASTSALFVSAATASCASDPGGIDRLVLICVAMFRGTVSTGGSTTRRRPTMSNWRRVSGVCASAVAHGNSAPTTTAVAIQHRRAERLIAFTLVDEHDVDGVGDREARCQPERELD